MVMVLLVPSTIQVSLFMQLTLASVSTVSVFLNALLVAVAVGGFLFVEPGGLPRRGFGRAVTLLLGFGGLDSEHVLGTL